MAAWTEQKNSRSYMENAFEKQDKKKFGSQEAST